MEWSRFVIRFAGCFRPFKDSDGPLIRALQPIVQQETEDHLFELLGPLAERFNASRSAGINPPLPTAWEIRNAIERDAAKKVKSDRNCMTCFGSGYVRCAHDRSGNPVPAGSADKNVYIAASDFVCPCCRGNEYADYAMKEAVKRCCTSTGRPVMEVIAKAYKQEGL